MYAKTSLVNAINYKSIENSYFGRIIADFIAFANEVSGCGFFFVIRSSGSLVCKSL